MARYVSISRGERIMTALRGWAAFMQLVGSCAWEKQACWLLIGSRAAARRSSSYWEGLVDLDVGCLGMVVDP